MKKTPLTLIAAGTLGSAILLAGCSNPADANDSNFEKTINDKLSSQCLVYNPAGITTGTLGSHTYPVAIPLWQASQFQPQSYVNKMNALHLAPYKQAVKAGLLEEKDGEAPKSFGKGNGPAKIFSLTDKGKKALAPASMAMNGKSRFGFCAGHYEVDSIDDYTKPSKMGSYTVSEVNFTYSLKDEPDWAKLPEIEKSLIGVSVGMSSDDIAGPRNGNAYLVQTNKGWKVDGGMGL